MIDSQVATLAASVTPTTVNQQRAKLGHKSRDSVQRQQSWWLPYCILEFDLNEVRGTSSLSPSITLLTLPYRFSLTHSEEASPNQFGCTRRVCTSLPTYPYPNQSVPVPRIQIVFAGLPLSLPRSSRGFWQEPCSCLIRIHYAQGTTSPFASYSKWSLSARWCPPPATLRQDRGSCASFNP